MAKCTEQWACWHRSTKLERLTHPVTGCTRKPQGLPPVGSCYETHRLEAQGSQRQEAPHRRVGNARSRLPPRLLLLRQWEASATLAEFPPHGRKHQVGERRVPPTISLMSSIKAVLFIASKVISQKMKSHICLACVCVAKCLKFDLPESINK